MKQKDVVTKNNDLLNVMFRGIPCKFSDIKDDWMNAPVQSIPAVLRVLIVKFLLSGLERTRPCSKLWLCYEAKRKFL